MHPLIKSSIICGLGIFIVCAFSSFIKLGELLLVFIAFVPGFIFGIVLTAQTKESGSSSKNGLFILWSGLLYIGCFFLVDIKDDSNFIATLIPASTLGAALLFGGYYILIERGYTLFTTILYAVLLGLIAALPSSLFFRYYKAFGKEVSFYGIFLIFPIWQTAFSVLLIKCKIKTVINERF